MRALFYARLCQTRINKVLCAGCRPETLKRMNCDLLGRSIDSLFSHLAWTRNIQEKFDAQIPFPIIEYIKMKVARAYGMVHPGAADTQVVQTSDKNAVATPEGWTPGCCVIVPPLFLCTGDHTKPALCFFVWIPCVRGT